MDIKIIVALTTLAGIFVTALFGVTGYFYKVKLEEKKSARSVLYILLELRYSLITSLFSPSDACEQYIKHCHSRLKEKGIEASLSDMNKQLKDMLITYFSNIIQTIEIDIKKRLLDPFDSALAELAQVNPVLAYQLKGKENLEKILMHSDAHVKNINDAIIPELSEDWAKESISNTSQNVSSDVINKVCEHLDNEILLVAKSCSRKDFKKCKDVMKNGLNHNNKYDFSEVNELLDPVFEKLIEDAKNSQIKN